MSRRPAIPEPPRKPLIGHLLEASATEPIQSMMDLARRYGPIFRFEVPGQSYLIISSQALVHEACDETRFEKRVYQSLIELRAFSGDGLFTAYNDEPNWARAHRILMPSLGPIGVRSMFEKMHDVSDQMLVRWERFGPDADINVADDMTRLTLDTLALCAFDKRFNSFYREDMHPFVDSMVSAMAEAGNREIRPEWLSRLLWRSQGKFDADLALMHGLAKEIIDERRGKPRGSGEPDLLDRMLEGRDPQTGEKLDEMNIIYQMVTFLVAGHETTSGLLSFAVYLLLKHPDALAKARETVDQVVGSDRPRLDHLSKLKFLEQVLMESLRLWPTAPAFALSPKRDTLFAGQYPLTPQDVLLVLTPMLHRDASAWGDDVEAFRPERFADGGLDRLPPDSWKPFGSGARACIGRAFAMQEALLALTMLLQRFDIKLSDPNYQLRIKEALTLKPDGLLIRATPRVPSQRAGQAASSAVLEQGRSPGEHQSATPLMAGATEDLTELLVLYGGNTGTAQAFASQIVRDAAAKGFKARLQQMNEGAGELAGTRAAIIVTASYEGQPPDNATTFVPWLEALPAGSLSDVRFAVLGCGNRQWARTYQAIPKRVDAALDKAGAQRVYERGELDAAGDIYGDFDVWYAGLWASLAQAFGMTTPFASETASLTVTRLSQGREVQLQLADLAQATVIENRELVNMSVPGARSKRHIEIALPDGLHYAAGDYLAVLGRNPSEAVNRVLRRFQLRWDSLVKLEGPSGLALPVGQAFPCGELLSSYVELSTPASQTQVEQLAQLTRCPPERDELQALAKERYTADVLDRRVSLVDLLERFGSIEMSFERYLAMLAPLKVRQYSISSSPAWNARHVTLTVAVVDAPGRSGAGRFQGLASTYLASCQPGDQLSVAVRPASRRFRPPADVAAPMILICAGSGIAPFRGFLQERAALCAAGRPVGRCALFFGFDREDVDYLYRDELDAWRALGFLDVFIATSEAPDGDVRFVQDRLWAERATVARMLSDGAFVFVCGDGQFMAPAVRETLTRIYQDSQGLAQDEAQRWAQELDQVHGRYAQDVFG